MTMDAPPRARLSARHRSDHFQPLRPILLGYLPPVQEALHFGEIEPGTGHREGAGPREL
jgi:hypothetical protein